MKSRIAEEIRLQNQPVAIIFTDDKPEDAVEFKPGVWSCVIAMLTASTKGKTGVFSEATCTCQGGKIGLCFVDTFQGTPGEIEYFLSTGKGEGYPEGEGYKKTPELAKTFVDQLPMTVIPHKYVVFKPLSEVDIDKETPEIVAMLVNADQLSALGVLANYGRPGMDAVIAPFGAGCHTICLLPYNESKKDQPKAIIGCMDISARPYVDKNQLSFAVPYKMFREMEDNVPGSFLERPDWQKIQKRIYE